MVPYVIMLSIIINNVIVIIFFHKMDKKNAPLCNSRALVFPSFFSIHLLFVKFLLVFIPPLGGV